MSALSKILRSVEGGRIMFRCPGCEASGMGFGHVVTVDPPPGYTGPVWGYNRNPDSPTITPSILCTRRPDEVCHSFVTDGRIQYLSDCTHALAGQTVDIPPWDEA